MGDKQQDFDVKPFSALRQITVEGGRMASRRHPIHGLIEADVTLARQIIHDYAARTGETFSFTAFIIGCLGQALEQHKQVQAYRDWRGRLIIFHDVDVNMMVEVDVKGRKIPVPHFVRAANRKTANTIHHEIRAFQAGYQHSGEMTGLRWFARLPGFMRAIFYFAVFNNPFWLRRVFGTVGVTAIGMFGRGGGWGIPFLIHSLEIALGGMARKPGVVDDSIAIRDYLSITISFDHDVIDGAPAARFIDTFRDLIERAYGLDELTA